MNLKRKKGLKGAITVYVMMMFGLIIVLYLFGFTNPWNAYVQDQNLSPVLDDDGNVMYERNTDGTIKTDAMGDPIPIYSNVSRAGGIGVNILDWIMNGIQGIFQSAGENLILTIIASVVTLGGFWLISKVGGQYVLAYIVPLIILGIFANIFLFPTASLQGAIVAPFDIIVFTFLNLFLVLSYLDFVKGSV
jgi:hypothetical protein